MIWFRRHVMRFLRRFMTPIPGQVAKTWHDRLTFAYVSSAFCVFMMTLYQVKKTNPDFKSRIPGDKAHNLARDLGLTNPTIIRVSKDGIKYEKYVVPHDYDKR